MNPRIARFARITATAGVLVAASAHAQVDAERFKSALTHDGWVVAESTSLRDPSDPWQLGLIANYARSSLVVVDADGHLDRQLVSGRLGVELFGSMTVLGPVAIAVGLPGFTLQTGRFDPSCSGIGDARFALKLRILDDRESLGLALMTELRAPTHAGDFAGGARQVVVVPRAILDHRWRSGLGFTLNAGWSWRQRTTLHNVEAGSEILYAVAASHRFGGMAGATDLGLEIDGALGTADTDREELPLEAFAFFRQRIAWSFDVVTGPGIGLLSGYGVPVVRFFLGVRFAPTAYDTDHDTVPDARDRCPTAREDVDRDRDRDGCPEEDPDGDRDGVPDAIDQCPSTREVINGIADDDGCPDRGPPRIIFEAGELKILDRVKFDRGSARVAPESHSILDQMALTLKANPHFRWVSIEGHTDPSGPEYVNLRLSWQRAAAVRRYLVQRGVDPRRLTVWGHGSKRPRSRGTDEMGRARNRRVEFIVKQ